MIQLPGYQPTTATRPLAEISAAAAAAPARALQSIAQGIDSVGDRVAAIDSDLARIDNTRTLSEARQKLAEHYAQFQLDLQQDPDPQSRLDKTRSFLSDQESSLFHPDHPPVVAEQIAAHLSDFSSRALIAATQDARNLQVRRAKLAIENEYATAKQTLDRDAYHNVRSAAADIGMLPEELAQLDAEFDRHVEFRSSELLAAEEPLEAIRLFQQDQFLTEHPHLTSEDRDRLQRYATQKIQEKRADEIELLTQAQLTQQLTPQDLEAARHLSPADRGAFRSALEKAATETPISQQEYLDAWRVADSLRAARTDPAISDEAYRIAHNEARIAILAAVPPSLQGDLKKELGYLSPAGRSAPEQRPESFRADLEAIGREVANRAHAAGVYGDVSKDAPFEVKERAARTAEDIRLKIKRFIASRSPLPTPEEIRQYADDLNGTAIDGHTPLIPAIPAPYSIDSEIDSLLIPFGEAGAPSSAQNGSSGHQDIFAMVKHFEAGGTHEGFYPKAYWDHGQWSIGYGTKAKPGEVIDKAEAERRLASELAAHRQRVIAEAKRHNLRFTPPQIDALTSFDYNTGKIETLLAKGSRTPAQIAAKMLEYVKASGVELPGLKRRRLAEQQVFLHGYPPAPFPASS